MNKLIALAVALSVATPAFAQDAKKPANPAAGNTPVVTTPTAKPADIVKPQPAATTATQKPADVKKDDVKKTDTMKPDAMKSNVKKDDKKADVKATAPVAGKVATPAAPVAGKVPAPVAGKTTAPAQKTSEKAAEIKKQ